MNYEQHSSYVDYINEQMKWRASEPQSFNETD